MANKSILEQALLQVEKLEEAVKANAKGILASTMKQELNNLLKEQEEKDPEKDEENPEDKEKDVTGDVKDIPGDETNDEPTADEKPTGEEPGGEELPAVDDEKPEEGIPSEDETSDDVLDMTGASEEEVLKVFKAMKPEDGIVVKKEGDTVQFSDEGNEYIIKLDDNETAPEETPGGEIPSEETPEGLAEQAYSAVEPTDTVLPTHSSEAGDTSEADEIVYEIELDEEDKDQPFTKASPKGGVKKLQANETVTVTKSVTAKDGQPFEKAGTEQGKKLRATEVKEDTIGGAERPGTPPEGLGKPEVKEPGKGKSTKTIGDVERPGTPPAGEGKPELKEPGKGTSTKTIGDVERPGNPPKGEGKPTVQEPGVGKKVEASEEECKECGGKDVKEVEATEAARTKWNIHGDKGGADRAGIKGKKLFKAGSQPISEELEVLRKQNDEYRKALVLFKDKLNEVAVFNANLAYATRLFTEHSTTKQEKLNILRRFDTVSVITESKNLYNTIKAELETQKPVTEAVVDKIASTPTSSSTEVLSEAKVYENFQFKRMKELMKKIN
jgi:hypothetical protein